MPLPPVPTGWAPQQLLSGIQGGSVPYTPPDWATPEVADQARAFADQWYQSPTPPPGASPGIQRAWGSMTPEQRYMSLANFNAARATPGGQYGNSELANGLVQAGIIGTGIGSAFANLGGGAAAAPAGDGLAPISVSTPMLPGGTGAGVGAVNAAYGGAPLASIPGYGAATVAGSTTAAGAAGGAGAGAFGNFLSKYGDYVLPAVNAGLGYVAAGKATDAETAAYDRAITEQARQYDQTRTDYQPWMDLGRQSVTNLSDPAKNFLASPGYEWARSEGIRDIGNQFSAIGGAQSGNALKRLAEWQTGLAQQDFGNWTNQELAKAGLGTTGVNAVTTVGSNTTNNTGNYLAGQGLSRSSGVLGKYGAIGNAINDSYYNRLYRRRG